MTARLGELDLPVLVTSGGHDEMPPGLVRPLVDGIRGAEWVIFDNSAHLAPVEEPKRYLAVVETFLSKAEAERG